MTLSRLALGLFSLNLLDSCLDKGTQASDCTVVYQLPSSVATSFKVLATQPRSCPVFVPGASEPTPTPTAGTVRMNELLAPEDGLVEYEHVDRLGLTQFEATGFWFPGSGGTAVSNFTTVLSIGGSGYETGMTSSADRLFIR
jgi:hypothetical protein